MSRRNTYELNHPLLEFSRRDPWTLNDASQGTSIMGATGSGKTSGSGATIAKAFLRSKMAGIVMCAKPEERELWEKQYAPATGREQDIVVFSPEKDAVHDIFWRFNFLAYEMLRPGRGGGHTENIVNLVTRIAEIAEGTHDLAGKEPFWERAMRQMVRNAVDILGLAQGTLSLSDIVRFIRTAPQTPEEAKPGKELVRQLRENDQPVWWDISYCAQCLEKAEANAQTPREQHDFATASDYWLHEFPHLGDRTRGGIVSTFTSVADQLLHGVAWELFCSDVPTNIVPEMTYKDGAVIILDLPIQEFQVLGRVAQGIFKYMWQRAILRRDPRTHPRPVFLWADEAQNFISSYDYQYQAVARSARACTVYMTQNISNYYSVLGGANSQAEAHAFLANLQTKIWHANGDPETNSYASNVLGQSWQVSQNYGASTGDSMSHSGGGSDVVQAKLLDSTFTTLRKGGPHNNLEVEGIVFQGGRVWHATQETYLKAMFKQG